MSILDPSKNIRGSTLRVAGEDYLRYARPEEDVGCVRKFYSNTEPVKMEYDFVYTPPNGKVSTIERNIPTEPVKMEYDFVYTPPNGKVSTIERNIPTKDTADTTDKIQLVQRITGTASEGTFAQLLSRGPQDVFLSYNPEISFFRQVYKRYTNFAVEHFEDNFPTTVRFGTRNTVMVSKRGDLVGSMILRVVLPNLNIPGGTWKQTIGYNIMDTCVLRIGDTQVQTIDKTWMDINDKMFCPDSKLPGLNKLVKRDEVLYTDQSHELLIPLKFFCCKKSDYKQQMIPILNLSTDINVYVDFIFEKLSSLVNMPPSGYNLPDAVSLQAGIIVESVFLDETEKFRFAQTSTTIMFDPVYRIDTESFLTTTNGQIISQTKIDIDLRELNKPVKYFAIVAYPEDNFSFEYHNIFTSGTFYLNSNQQFPARSSEYFTTIQPYQHGRRADPTNNILMFSFALDTTNFQPSGSLNFAPYTKSKLSFDIIPQTSPKRVSVFAACINWIWFERGLCRLEYI